jgi:hypothetical protein
MLDLLHNSELVWSLGGYTRHEPGATEPDARPPRAPTLHEDETTSTTRRERASILTGAMAEQFDPGQQAAPDIP